MLGDQLSDALTNLTQLIMKTKDPAKKKSLLNQHEQLAGELQILIDKMVDQALPEYAAATAALETANQQAEAAKLDLDKLAASITSMAKAIDKVMLLAAKVGLA
jgi:uncharacterized UBP type Zn finger protein